MAPSAGNGCVGDPASPGGCGGGPGASRAQPLGFAATQARDGTIIVVLSGEFDIGNRRALAQRLTETLQHKPRRLVFDLAGVSFVDCGSARLIVGTGRSLPGGGRPVLSCPPPVVRTVLQLTGLAALCELTDAPPEPGAS